VGRGGEGIEGETSPPSSNHFQLNSWGFKRCVYTLFFPTESLRCWLRVHYIQGGRFFYFAGFSTLVGFEDVG
jgi:hypothetical protein